MDNGNLLVIFFTFTPDGRQFWTLGVADSPPADGPLAPERQVDKYLDAVSRQ